MAKEIFNRENYDALKKRVLKANKAIDRIEKKFGESSWGVNTLYNKLNNETYNAITKGGKIKLNKKMSDIQLKAIEKATNNFLNNKKTSTLTGIRSVVKDVKSTLASTLGDKDTPLSNREINKLYDLVEDKDKRITTEQIGASNIWTTLVEAKETGIEDVNEYYDLVEKRADLKLDEDDRDFLEDIFLRYFNKR